MSKTESRRVFLGNGAVIGAGIALGAFTRASLAATPKVQAENVFLDRSDHRLDEAEIRKLLKGNTMIGVTHRGSEYVAYLGNDGTVDKRIDVRREVGRWIAKLGALYFQFPTLANGERFGLQIYEYKQGVLYKGWSPDEKRWTWFVVEPGKAKELA